MYYNSKHAAHSWTAISYNNNREKGHLSLYSRAKLINYFGTVKFQMIYV